MIYKMNKDDLRLKELINEMSGKSKKEMTKIMIREGILVPTQQVKTEFNITQTRRSFLKRIINGLKFLKR